ncbi:MAG: sulfatase [Chloroflexi bacterium]|nr:sulfatase [Chloroflexota bacterium]
MQQANLVVFVPHDLGQHLGCYGIDTVHSEHIDRLAAAGVRFSRSFCAAPQCSPSRATLFSGRYPHSNGVMGLTHGDFAWELNAKERHLAELLQDAGYYSVLTASGHEDQQQKHLARFDEILPGDYCDSRADAVVDFFKRWQDNEQPFFVEIEFFEPHRLPVGYGSAPDYENGVTVPPYILDEHSSREDFAEFQGAIRSLDQAVGRIMQGLEEAGLGENTLVVFTADHGIPFPRAKCSLYDPGLEVPLIFWQKGAEWMGGRIFDAMISNVDYVPTLLDLLGLSTPDNVQGRSFANLLRAEPYQPRTEIFAELTYHDYYDPRRCIRTERHKLILNFTAAPFFMDPSQSWRPKCVTVKPDRPAYAYHPSVELYDLETDPLEFTNLADYPGYADVRLDLLERLKMWMVDTRDPLLQGVPVSPMHRRAWAELSIS